MSLVAIASGQLSAEVDPQGAQLFSLRDAEGRDLLWDGDPAVWKGRAPILFPIIGELKDGVYWLEGRRYALPRHGFARNRLFDVAAQGPDHVRLRLTADDATHAVYPFSFVLEIEFRITAATLAMTATITNHGQADMPASFGFHPAFRWPLPYGAVRADHHIVFDAAEPEPIRQLDANGLLIPAPIPTPVQGQVLPLVDALFEHDALVFEAPASRGLFYGADRGLRLAWDMPQLGIWTKPGAGFLCIEPWQGHADAEDASGNLFDKPGMMRIVPGGARTMGMQITLSQP